MEKLVQAAAVLLAYSWTAHLNIKGQLFWPYHKMLDKVYHDAIETVDRINESAVQHGFVGRPTSESPHLENVDIIDVLGDLKIIIHLFIDELLKCKGTDEGVDNMIGDEAEKWSKWADYFITRSISTKC